MVVDKLWFGNNLPEHIPVLQEDLFDIDVEALQRFDTVIFLAGLSNDPMADYSPKQNFIANGAGPAYLAYVAKKAGCERFIHGGSCSVYGNSPGWVMNEIDAVRSDFPYGLSKIHGESSAMLMADAEFSVIGMRKGTVSGHSPRMRFDLIVNRMVRDAMMYSQINVNNPDIWRPILSIQDAARAYVAAVEAPHSITGVFNIASGNFTVGQVALAVQAFMNAKTPGRVLINTQHKPDKRDYKVSCDRASSSLGFFPRDNLSTIIGEVYDRWQSYKDPSNPRYYNVDTFKAFDDDPGAVNVMSPAA